MRFSASQGKNMNKTIKLSLVTSALFTTLQAQSTDLGTVVVTSATKSQQSIKDVTSNVSVITSKELEEKHYTTVAQALSSVAGINITSNGGLGQTTSVFMRGFATNRVLVLVDGVRYNDVTGLSGADFAHLMISDIERIEVVKGAQSGIWGADASAGVINIITKEAKKGVSASANLEYGSFATTKHNVGVSYKEDNYYLKVSSQIIDSAGFSARAPRGSDLGALEDDAYKNITSNVKLGFNINETNKIDVSHTVIDAKTEYDGSSNDVASANNATAKSSSKSKFTKINFNHIDSFNEVDLYASRSIFDREQASTEFDGEVYEYGLKSNIPYREKDFVVWGVDYKSFEYKKISSNKDKDYNNKAFFITNSNVFGSTIITESIRTDIYNEFDNKTTGKLGLKHNFTQVDGLAFAANYGTAYNVPTLYNLYGYGGNEDLKPESTTSYDVSVEYKVLKLTYFYSEIEDMIDWEGAGYLNIAGSSTFKGFEIEYKDEVVKDLLVTANFSYLDAQDKDAKKLARRAKNNASFALDYYGVKDLHLGLDAQYVGERYDGADESGAQTGKYTLTNFTANYNISKNIKTYVKVDNITDKYYQVVDGYATPERSYYAGLSVKY
jgi:vitamin B12 transporter